MTPEQAIQKVTTFLRVNPDCELPLDLAASVMDAGLDVDALVASIIEEM